ncbi:hypothetical protein SDC9_199334 [bioreactor metagenome]|uniref:Uncharacterized protein n=1 Tax=bioreactor metagenome TaxID=1076179 RepID=A0A645IK54_9ZZZZ
MQSHRHVGRFIRQRQVDNIGVNSRQCVRVVTTFANLLALSIGTEVSPHRVIQLQIATTCGIESVDRIAPGGRQIVKIVLQIRIDRGIDIFTSAAKVQHAGAGNRHLRLGVTANALQIAKIFQHRMIAERQFTRDPNAMCFGLYAVKLNSLL